MHDETFRDDFYDTAIRGVQFALRLPEARWANCLVERFFGRFMRTMIDVAATFDQLIEEQSINHACAWVSEKCGEPAEVHGAENIPSEGSVLLVSNHPGYFEGILTVANLPRQDIKVVVGGIPYFNHLPNARKHIFYTDQTDGANVNALRNSVRHLKSGGIFLIYPTGQADPDPDTMSGSMKRFNDWSESVALMLRRVPDAVLVPVIVSGIIAPKYFRHPLAMLPRDRRARIRAAGLFQIYRQFSAPDIPPISRPRLSFGRPVSTEELMQDQGKSGMMSAVTSHARDLLTTHMDRLDQRSSVWA